MKLSAFYGVKRKACHPRASVVQKIFFRFFGHDTSSGIQQETNNGTVFKNWIPDEDFHEKLKKFFGKSISGMTRIQVFQQNSHEAALVRTAKNLYKDF